MEIYQIGVDVGGTNIRIGYGRRAGDLMGFERVPSEKILGGHARPWEALAGLIRDYAERKGIREKLKAAAIGLPAALSADRKRILQAPNLDGLDGVPMGELLETDLGIPVYLEKDVNMIFQNDSRGMEYEGLAAGIYIGTGIGNAVFCRGKPILGADGTAGELGHIPLRGSGEICGCGNTGCAECLASGSYLAKLRLRQYPGTEIGELFSRHGREPELRQFVDDVAMVAATEINILNPDFLILGGGVLAMADFPKERLAERIHYWCRKPWPDQTLRLYFAEESQKSGVMGAIAHAEQKWREKGRKKIC